MWRYVTDEGAFFIRWTRDGTYEVVFGNQKVGSYRSPSEAAANLAGGNAFVPGLRTTLSVPSEISGWEFVPRRNPARSEPR